VIGARLKQGATDWLKLTGEAVSYYSATTGQTKTINVTLEQDVTTMDDDGMYTRGLMLNLDPKDVPDPDRGDLVTYNDGRIYRVDQILDSPGYLTRLYVSPG
jgi:hypothetical protein